MKVETLSKDRLRISVIGLGYVGLPTAVGLFEAGHSIIGVDVSQSVIETLSDGRNHLNDSSEEISIPLKSNRWSLSEKYDAIIDSEVIIITVPTPITRKNEPDLSYVEAAIGKVMEMIEKDSRTILVLESTVYPGVTRQLIEKYANTHGKSEGSDFFFAYCPERINPGVKGRGISTIQRIVGCDNEPSAELLTKMYSEISLGATFVGSPEVAEAAKLIENVQRDVDLALTNELAVVLSNFGLDSEEVFSAASSKWNFHRHKAGIGVGGHCIPVDPYYYLALFENQSDFEESIVRTSRRTNNSMPAFCSKQIMSELGLSAGEKVIVFGYSYKPNIGDIRNSPSVELVALLESEGLNVEVFDPHCEPPNKCDFTWHSEAKSLALDYSAIIVATDHDAFDLGENSLHSICPGKRIYDGRRALENKSFLERGWIFSAIGLGGAA